MPPKKQQKKEIVPIFKPSFFWQYKAYTRDELDKTDAFLTGFLNQLRALLQADKPLPHNYRTICEKMGVNLHPCLSKGKETDVYHGLNNNDFGDKAVIIQNHKIDAITLKILHFLLPVCKISCLKLTNNNLQNEANELRKLISVEELATTIFFEWNPLIESPARQGIFTDIYRPSLQHLVLRECKIGDEFFKLIAGKILQVPDCKLKSLDVYGNQLTNQVGALICSIVNWCKSLQFLGLSRNALNSADFVNGLVGSIGQIVLSQEELDQYKLKVKERDEIVERNKKRKKGAPEEPVAQLPDLKETEAGPAIVKNTSIRLLNMGSNGIKDNNGAILSKFAKRATRVEIFLEGNKLSKAMREMLKFSQNVIC